MKSSLPSTMPSGIHKRLYTVLPRAAVAGPSAVQSSPHHRPHPRPRSNSASLYTSSSLSPLSFFDSPPAPQTRLPPPPPRAEPKHQTNTNPNPLALTPSPPTEHENPFIHAPISIQYQYQYPHNPSSPYTTSPTHPLHPRQKRPRTRYQLDVGAYGIPKRCRHPRRSFHTHAADDMGLAVQVGEDAYFVRDNAMGVADGVGGWARTNPDPCPSSPSPSALFARRLMHFTSAQLQLQPDPIPDPGPVPDLDSHLADLSDGFDVLQIMERAYDQTVKAHVQPSTCAPLHTGSSTALVAVLDHVEASPEPVLKIAHIGDCMGMLVRGNDIVWRSEEMWWAFNTPVQLSPPPRPPTPPPPPPSTISSLLSTTTTTTTNFLTHPILSPSSSSTHLPFNPPPPPPETKITPRNTAQVLTLPVRPDDILILASDGLSDNLWDEDVLDEVVRFRLTWAAGVGEPPEEAEASGIKTTSDASTSTVQVSTSTSISSSSPSTSTPSSSSFESSSPVSPSPSSEPSPTPSISPLQRHTLAGMLSEALCSRARRVSERRRSTDSKSHTTPTPTPPPDNTPDRQSHRSRHTTTNTHLKSGSPQPDGSTKQTQTPKPETTTTDPDETPFGRRARELGKSFSGGKRDDISVLVAIVSPSPTPAPGALGSGGGGDDSHL